LRKGAAQRLISRIQREFEQLDDSSVLIQLNTDPISDFEIFQHFNADDAKERRVPLRHLEHDLLRFHIDRYDHPAQQTGGDGDLTGSQCQ